MTSCLVVLGGEVLAEWQAGLDDLLAVAGVVSSLDNVAVAGPDDRAAANRLKQ